MLYLSSSVAVVASVALVAPVAHHVPVVAMAPVELSVRSRNLYNKAHDYS